MSRHSDSGSDDGGDWDSEFEDEPIASLLVDGGRTVASASAAWAELRDATGFDYAAWRKAAGEETRKPCARAASFAAPSMHAIHAHCPCCLNIPYLQAWTATARCGL